MDTAVVVHGDEWARMSERLDKAEELNRELLAALKHALGLAEVEDADWDGWHEEDRVTLWEIVERAEEEQSRG